MNAECRSDVQQIRDGAEAFNVTVIETNQTSKRFLLFAVGRGAWMNFHQMSPIHIPTGANFSPP